MHFQYEERTGEIFPHCIVKSSPYDNTIISVSDEVAAWLNSNLGPRGERWDSRFGYKQVPVACDSFGSIQYNPPMFVMKWQFRNKSDAVFFKLNWG